MLGALPTKSGKSAANNAGLISGGGGYGAGTGGGHGGGGGNGEGQLVGKSTGLALTWKNWKKKFILQKKKLFCTSRTRVAFETISSPRSSKPLRLKSLRFRKFSFFSFLTRRTVATALIRVSDIYFHETPVLFFILKNVYDFNTSAIVGGRYRKLCLGTVGTCIW